MITVNEYLDRLRDQYALTTDAALCRLIRISPPVLAKIRSGKNALSGVLFARLNEHLGVQMVELRALLHPCEFAPRMQPKEEA